MAQLLPDSSFRSRRERIPRAGDFGPTSPDRGREAQAWISIVLAVRKAARRTSNRDPRRSGGPSAPDEREQGNATTELLSEHAAAAPSAAHLLCARDPGRDRPRPPLGRVGRSGENEDRRRAGGAAGGSGPGCAAEAQLHE